MNRQRKTGLLSHGWHRSTALVLVVKVGAAVLLIVKLGHVHARRQPHQPDVRVDADEERLRGVRQLITNDLERFGKREQLTVAWQQVQASEQDRQG